jgi:hypothetical protein
MIGDGTGMPRACPNDSVLHHDAVATDPDRTAILADQPRAVENARPGGEVNVAADRRIGGDHRPRVDRRSLACMFDDHGPPQMPMAIALLDLYQASPVRRSDHQHSALIAVASLCTSRRGPIPCAPIPVGGCLAKALPSAPALSLPPSLREIDTATGTRCGVGVGQTGYDAG